jgi:16S rRNA (guanine966-N2)-methyltransferase
MTRVIAGMAKGQQLQVPTTGTRPTSDRVRESVFSATEHVLGGWSGVKVLDLYAGSGALGLEAVSRGAHSATLVESSAQANSVIRANIAKTGLDAHVVKADVTVWLAKPASARFDLVFIDPPYSLAGKLVTNVLKSLVSSGWLADGGVVVVERDAKDAGLDWPDGFTAITRRRFGNTSVFRGIWYFADSGDR